MIKKNLILYISFSFIGVCLGVYFDNMEEKIFLAFVFFSMLLTLIIQLYIDSNSLEQKKIEQERKLINKKKKEMLEFGSALIELGFKDEDGKYKPDSLYYYKKMEEKNISFSESDRRFICSWDKDDVYYRVTSPAYIKNTKELKIQYEKMRIYLKRISYK